MKSAIIRFMADNKGLPKAISVNNSYTIGDINIRTVKPSETLIQAQSSLQSLAKVTEGVLKENDNTSTE